LIAKIEYLHHEVENLKNQFSKWIKEMQDGLNKKADMEALKLLEQSLIERLNEMVKALAKQFSDKTDTKKAMKLLERQMKNLYDLYISRGSTGHTDHEDDAMFTKKPLGGMSCASCQKDIVNL
jgi:predicted transcriptional regulator